MLIFDDVELTAEDEIIQRAIFGRIQAIKHFTEGKDIDKILNSKSLIDDIAKKTGLSKYYVVQILKKEKLPKNR